MRGIPYTLKLAGEHRIGVLGPPQSGLTCYMAAVDYLISRGLGPKGWKRSPGDSATSLYLQQVIRGLHAGEWPPPGPADVQELHLRLYAQRLLDRRLIHLNAHDGSGTFVAKFTRTDRWEEVHEARRFASWIKGCSGLLLLVDPERAHAEDAAYQRLLLGLERSLAVGDRELIPLPVAFVFTKADRWAVPKPPAAFRQWMPELADMCSVRVHDWSVFACSAVGSTAGGRPTQPLRPFGIVEPLSFLYEACARKQRDAMAETRAASTMGASAASSPAQTGGSFLGFCTKCAAIRMATAAFCPNCGAYY